MIGLEIPPFTPPLEVPYTIEAATLRRKHAGCIELHQRRWQSRKRLNSRLAASRLDDAAFRARNTLQPLAEGNAFPAVLYETSGLPAAATVGDVLRLSWSWQKLRAGDSNLRARLVWLDETETEAATSGPLPLAPGYPFSGWRVGEVSRGYHALIVPPSLAPGSYNLAIRLLNEDGQPAADLVRLGQAMTLTVPERQFEAPDFAFKSGAEWENGIALLGYDVRPGGNIALIWGTQRLQPASMHLFVHVLDAQDMIAAQWDGVPVNWTRPTTGWIEGEYVTTNHSFAVPAGEYHLRLGWYDPATGDRISVGQQDALLLEMPLSVE